MGHGMKPENARRIRLTGTQLKYEFIRKYASEGILNQEISLVQPPKSNQIKSVLVKAGRNWQFRLGRITEVENVVEKYVDGGKIIRFKSEADLSDIILTEKFLSSYAFHTSLFVARNGTNWQIFSSQEIVHLILDNCSIRILQTGRIKFDFHDEEKVSKGIMTIEYRAEKSKQSWVFGAHGGNSGERLRKILNDHLLSTELPL